MQIPRRKELCIFDGKKLQAGAECISFIWNEQGNWQREDYCHSCWQNVQREKNQFPSSCFWKIIIPQKVEKSSLKNAHKAVELFMDLAIHENDEKMLYVLALYLERKKQIFKRQELKNKNTNVIIYEIPSREETFSIKPSIIKEEEVQILYDELTRRLSD